MKKLYKILCLVLILAMMAGLCCFGSFAAYKDADRIRYKEAVDVLSSLGILSGDENGFRPGDGLKRAEACKIIAFLCGAGDVSDASLFIDCKGHWADRFIAFCASAGYVNGVGSGKFDPEGALTGNAFAKMLFGFLGYKAEDAGMTGADWQTAVAKLTASTGLSKGINNFDGTVAITREEAAQLAFNALQTTAADPRFAFVLATNYTANRGEVSMAAYLLHTDGTGGWVNVSGYDGKAAADTTKDAFSSCAGKFVSYTVKNGMYDITHKTTSVMSGPVTVTQGKTKLFGTSGYTADDSTVFVVKNGTDYTAYTGVENVPTFTAPIGSRIYILADTGKVVRFVYIIKSTSAGSGQVYIYDKTVLATENIGSDTVYTYNAIVQGEDTTLRVDKAVVDAELLHRGLYINNYYSYKGYLTEFGAYRTANENVRYFDLANDGVDDVTLRDDILTVKSGASAVDTFVMADIYNAWIIQRDADDSVQANELVLGTTGAVDALEGYELYNVTLVLDDDGYVSDIYVWCIPETSRLR